MTETSGEWREERLYVLRTIERLETAVQGQAGEIAVYRDREQKHIKDLNEAHARIRTLQTSAARAWWKIWAPVIGVIALELVRFALTHKP